VLEQFLNHLSRHQLIAPRETILLAVSGGVDSMVMLDLFAKARVPFAVAHCNFQLRPAEAANEELLVERVCERWSVPFHKKVFQTTEFAHAENIGIQEAARSLRYTFFDSLLESKGYAKVATAHHLNDSFETVLLNLVRGTGLDGLTGIPMQTSKVIRPLLFATREAIMTYANAEKIEWLEDSSNEKEAYKRNLLRHKVIPVLRQINPSLEETFRSTLERIEGARQMSREYIAGFRLNSCRVVEDRLYINRDALSKTVSPVVLLWEVLKDYGINFDQAFQIFHSSQTGKVFHSHQYTVLYDRGEIIGQSRQSDEFLDCRIDRQTSLVASAIGKLTLEISDVVNVGHQSDNIATLDADQIMFPIVWRKWKDGDSFYPLGMQQRKKVSDFLIDLKIDRLQKQQITVLEAGGEIIWVVGLRISNKVKLTTATQRVLRITFDRARF
jgi:tRNA(Ile)-lysidine synthase